MRAARLMVRPTALVAVPAFELLHLPHDDRTGGNAYPGYDRLAPTTDVFFQSLDQLKPCLHGALSIVLMGCGIAEIREHAVAQKLRDLPAEGLDNAARVIVIGA